MTDPLRWRMDGSAPAGVEDLLRKARQPRPMTKEERSRSAMRVDRLAALPVAAGALLWLKGAALAATVGVATIAVVQLAPPMRHEATSVVAPATAPRTTVTRPVAASTTSASTLSAPASASAGVAVVPSPERPSPSLPRAAARDVDRESPREDAPSISPAPPPVLVSALPPPESPPSTASAAVPPPSVSAPSPADSLAQEAAMLEEARALLGKNPAAALAKLDAHAAAFPRGKMGLERELMAVDALRRMGRSDAARSRAEALAARTRGTIYEDRVNRLLEQLR